jgi:23S rRNA pseudouridine1911/1915/1917 synthase
MSVISGIERPGLVHRLDKDTSGLLVVAKNDRTMLQLQRMMNKRTIKKHYLALVVGTFAESDGYIESFIGRDPHDRTRMTVVGPVNPKLAQTRFRVLGTLHNKYSLVEVDLLTGRTHQIRVHFASISHPIVGDQTYGIDKINAEFEEKY